MSVASQVFRLEQLDAELDQCQAALLEGRRRQQRNPQLEAAEARITSLRTNERAATLHQRALESELADLEGKIKRGQTRLYGGQMIDPREIASLEKEIQQYNAQRSELEGQLLEAMERSDAFQEEIGASTASVDQIRQKWEHDRPTLAGQAEELTKRIERLQSEREPLIAGLDHRTLSIYTRLRTSSGHAVSRVVDGVCQWCRVVIPSKDVQHARAGSLVTCGNCSHILYVDR